MHELKFSVLISVYNKERSANLENALDSIYYQQTLKPNEIVLVEDGPLSEELYSVINKWEKKLPAVFKRVKIEKNSGLANALNTGLYACNNELVARMDSDDISLPKRFEIQLNFMLNNPHISIISGQIEEWNENLTEIFSIRKLPLRHKDITKFIKRRSPLSHPAVFFKKSAILASGGYPSIYPEDYALWGIMLSEGFLFANVEEIVLKMRMGESAYKRRGYKFLKGEIRVYALFYNLQIINLFELITAIIIRIIIRLSPTFIKYIFYKNLR